jgi:hypothetical protein
MTLTLVVSIVSATLPLHQLWGFEKKVFCKRESSAVPLDQHE